MIAVSDVKTPKRAVEVYAIVILTLVLGFLLPAVLGSSVAYAEEPRALNSHFEDRAGVVGDSSVVATALAEVPGEDLWVVIVKDFSGIPADRWAQSTFELSRLTDHHALVAISVGTSELGYYAGTDTPYSGGKAHVLTKEVLENCFTTSVLDSFGDGDWEAGIVAMAHNARSLMRGDSPDTNRAPTDADPASSGDEGSILIGFLLVIGVLTFVIVRYNKKKHSAKAHYAEIEKTAQRAGSILVEADDALRTASAELEFARAEFGIQATQSFELALKGAQEQLQYAFALRTLLDDDQPETPEQQQQMNAQILDLAHKAQATVKAQQQGFSELRKLSARAEEKLAELSSRVTEIKQQVPLAQAKLDSLALMYSPSSFSTIATYPQQVTTLLQNVQESLDKGQERVSAGDRNGAVQYAKLAESTLDESARMIQILDQAPTLLKDAQDRLAKNVASLSSDVEDAQRLGGSDAAILGAARTAQELLAQASREGDHDLIDLNEKLEQAEAKLDATLEGVRQREQVEIKQRANADSARQSAQEYISQAEEMINRYRSGVGADARTILARAKADFSKASTAPLESQVRLYQSASRQAKKAMKAVQSSFEASRRSDSGNSDLGGVLAGMVISSVINGITNSSSSHHSRGSSGFGSSGFGGSGFGSSGGGFGSGGSRSFGASSHGHKGGGGRIGF